MPFVLEVIIKVKLNLIILGVDSMQYLYLILVAEKLVSSISAFLFVSGVISPNIFFLLNIYLCPTDKFEITMKLVLDWE